MSNYQPDQTLTFPLATDKEKQDRMILQEVYAALLKKGYNPINQIVGYLLSEDPTYITNYKNARTIISKLDRDELLRALVEDFIRLEQKG